MSNLVQFENRDGIGLLTLSSPETLNAFDSAMMKAFAEKLEEVSQENLHVLIITGSGKAFVAGASIKEMVNLNPEEAKEFARFGHETFKRLEDMPFPTIAMVNGFALGGGSELALSCDLRFASEKAKLGQPEVGLGIPPGYGGTQRLAELIGPSKAKDYIFTGRVIGAAEALEVGWVDRVFAPEELEAKTFEYAESIKKNSRNAIAQTKAAIFTGLRGGDGYQAEINAFSDCFSHPDQKEGMSAFLEKKPANFK